MQIAILSDTHDRHATVATALDLLRLRGVTTVLHCGDIESPSTVELFAGLNAHFVFGNCDWDKTSLRQAIVHIGATLHEPFGHVELEGVKVAFLHGHEPVLMHDVANSGHFDFLFYGHTHMACEHVVGSTRVINPGALHRALPKTLLLLDLATRQVESLVVSE